MDVVQTPDQAVLACQDGTRGKLDPGHRGHPQKNLFLPTGSAPALSCVTMAGMFDTLFLIYFDLRRYSHMARNFSGQEQCHLLSGMHQIIEKEMDGIGGNLYQIHLDTALYSLSPSESDRLVETLITIKERVDNYFKKRKIPSVLHISCAFGEGEEGDIHLRNKTVFNIMGEVTHSLQQTIRACESPEGAVLFEGICLHRAAAERTGSQSELQRITLEDGDFYYHKGSK